MDIYARQGAGMASAVLVNSFDENGERRAVVLFSDNPRVGFGDGFGVLDEVVLSHAFPTGENDGHAALRIGVEEERGAFVEEADGHGCHGVGKDKGTRGRVRMVC
jgi:hypothetical protein